MFDLHIHSRYSYDSFNKIDDILKTAKAKGLAGIAITDHEEFAGSIEASAKAKIYDLLVIPAMEIATDQGDVIGLFIKEKVTAEAFHDVVGEIREQGGLSVLAHPYKRAREIPADLLQQIDLIEVYNARGESIGNNACNQRAQDLAHRLGKPISAGSDAHFLYEIGRGCVDLGKVSDLKSAKEKLRIGAKRLVAYKESSKYVEVFSQFVKAYKKRDVKIYMSATKSLLRTTKWKLIDRLTLSRPKCQSG